MRPAATVNEVGRQLGNAGSRAAAHPVARRLARFGYLCKAVVYAVLATLALLAAAGLGGRATDSRGAISAIAREPYGRGLVGVLAVGMFALGCWFVISAFAERAGRGLDLKQVVMLVAKTVGGLLYMGLAVWAAGLALGEGPGPTSDAIARSLTGRTLALPGGRLVVAVGGVVALAIAFHQARNGWRANRSSHFARERMGAWLQAWAPRIALAGYGAQGLVFALMGIFLLQAAVESDPREATGFDGALAVLARQPAGMALLGAVALGLLMYAATAAIESRYKRL